jgi:hypothetical protein
MSLFITCVVCGTEGVPAYEDSQSWCEHCVTGELADQDARRFEVQDREIIAT